MVAEHYIAEPAAVRAVAAHRQLPHDRGIMSDRPSVDSEAPAPPALPGPLSAFEQLRDAIHRQLGILLGPAARSLGRAGVSPNQVSVAGAVLTAGAAVLILDGRPAYAGAVFVLGGLFDLLDGLLARTTGRATSFGAFLDSTLDRISEGVVFAAVAYVFAIEGRAMEAGAVVLALLFSQLVSYVRARAEGLGLDCKVGIVTRAERVVLMAAGLMSGLLVEAVWMIAAFSAATVVQRITHIGRQLDGRRR